MQCCLSVHCCMSWCISAWLWRLWHCDLISFTPSGHLIVNKYDLKRTCLLYTYPEFAQKFCYIYSLILIGVNIITFPLYKKGGYCLYPINTKVVVPFPPIQLGWYLILLFSISSNLYSYSVKDPPHSIWKIGLVWICIKMSANFWNLLFFLLNCF